jgi:hypothetical protein
MWACATSFRANEAKSPVPGADERRERTRTVNEKSAAIAVPRPIGTQPGEVERRGVSLLEAGNDSSCIERQSRDAPDYSGKRRHFPNTSAFRFAKPE